MKHKYPIGTKIKYMGCVEEDVGKEGTIVGYVGEDKVWIIVPNSYVASKLYGDSENRWLTFLENVEISSQKNQQLLFEFMKE